MKILVIGSDRSIFQEGSEARQRMIEYGALADEMHIIVFAERKFGFAKAQLSDTTWAHPTNSRAKWFYIADAARIGSALAAPDVVTAQDPFECGLAGWLIARRRKTPLQLQVHTDFLSPYFCRGSFLNRIRTRSARFLISRATRIRVVSERVRNSLTTHFTLDASRIDVLPIFIDTEKIKHASITVDLHKKYPRFDFIALMASRFTKEKNISLALAVVKKLIRQFPKLGLVVVGSGPDKERLRSETARLGIKGYVVFEPWADDLASYYKTADVFLLTSNYEGYGRTAVEALAAGIPVVMTDVGLAGEIVKNGENGFVAPVGDAPAFAQAIRNVIEKRNKLALLLPPLPTKEEYLKEYKKSWERCV